MLSSVALLACGLLVFGRPLGVPFTSLLVIYSTTFSFPFGSGIVPLSPQSAPGAPLTNLDALVSPSSNYQYTAVPLLSSPDRFANTGGNIQPGAPAVTIFFSSDGSTNGGVLYQLVSPPSRPDQFAKTGENSQPGTPADTNFFLSNGSTNGDFPNQDLEQHQLLSQVSTSLLLPSDFRDRLTKLKNNDWQYCIFELAQDDQNLRVTVCRSGSFKTDISTAMN